MATKKPVKRPKSPSSPARAGGQDSRLVTIVGCLLTVGFAWVVWPVLADLFTPKSNDHEAERMARESPDAEVFSMPSEDSKKKP